MESTLRAIHVASDQCVPAGFTAHFDARNCQPSSQIRSITVGLCQHRRALVFQQHNSVQQAVHHQAFLRTTLAAASAVVHVLHRVFFSCIDAKLNQSISAQRHMMSSQ